MEYIEDYKGVQIYKEYGMFTVIGGGHISDINILKKIIDKKHE